jgi:hypothetical protein
MEVSNGMALWVLHDSIHTNVREISVFRSQLAHHDAKCNLLRSNSIAVKNVEPALPKRMGEKGLLASGTAKFGNSDPSGEQVGQ